jgi:hypothetical protein
MAGGASLAMAKDAPAKPSAIAAFGKRVQKLRQGVRPIQNGRAGRHYPSLVQRTTTALARPTPTMRVTGVYSMRS